MEGLIIRIAITSNVFEVLIIKAIDNLWSAGWWVDHLEVAKSRMFRRTSIGELLPELVANLDACPWLHRLVNAPLSHCIVIDELGSVGAW